MKCPKCQVALTTAMAANGVLLDGCPTCGGCWFDPGELDFFVRDRAKLGDSLQKAFAAPALAARKCPRCEQRMGQGRIEKLALDRCSTCLGLWVDKGEIDALNAILDQDAVPDVPPHPPVEAAAPSPAPTAAPTRPQRPRRVVTLGSLPNLGLRSGVVLLGLYGLLAGFFGALTVIEMVPLEWSVGMFVVSAAFQFLISPWLMDLSLRWINGVKWVDLSTLPRGSAQFLTDLCRKHGIKTPSLGIIEDGNPNAFTYGHVPSNARLVVTRGIIDMLDEDELNGVLGHEVGHILHWDMLVMTLAALVPYLLYAFYKACMRASRGSNDRRGNATAPILGAAVTALALYYITTYLVLFLSRLRELHADRFSGRETGKPNALASGLVKVAYGLAGGGDDEKSKARKEELEAVRAMGIFDPVSARALVASSLGLRGAADPELVCAAMQWDLWNPWAAVYEFQSSHPLPAKRIERLGEQAEAMGQEPFVRFDMVQPESYWDEFLVDCIAISLPWVGAVAAFGLFGFRPLGGVEYSWLGSPLIGYGLGYLARMTFTYGGLEYAEQTVASLLRKVKVSKVRAVRATLRGTVVGRGDPGSVLSEDFALRDLTGLIFLDYSQPIGILELWFALMRRQSYQGKEVVAEGFYRRAPVPYVELRTITVDGQTRRCWTLEARAAFGVLTALGGFWLRFM